MMNHGLIAGKSFFFRIPAVIHHPADRFVLRTGQDQNFIKAGFHSGFIQQRYFRKDQILFGMMREETVHAFNDGRMNDRIESLPLFLIMKNNLSHFLPVDLSEWIENRLPEKCDDFFIARIRFLIQNAGIPVAVKDRKTHFSQQDRNRCFSGSNGSGNTDSFHMLFWQTGQ